MLEAEFGSDGECRNGMLCPEAVRRYVEQARPKLLTGGASEVKYDLALRRFPPLAPGSRIVLLIP